MKITEVDIFHVDGGWDVWSLLRLRTDAGLEGWSEFSEARSRRGISDVIRTMKSDIVGEDPRRVGKVVAKIESRSRCYLGGLAAMALGAIDNACLDIKARSLQVSVKELFGGALRDRIPLYWSHCGLYRATHPELFLSPKPGSASPPVDFEHLGKEVANNGFAALKTNPLVLNQGSPQIAKGVGAFAGNWDRRQIDVAVEQLSALRRGAGANVQLMMDLNFNFKPEGLRQFAKALEPLSLMWLEMDTANPDALADVRRVASTPIASCEALLGRRAMKPFLDRRAVDVALIDATFNGLTEAVKMASLCDAFEINVGAHNAHGPLGSLISAQFCAVIPNLRVMEFDGDAVPWSDSFLSRPVEIVGGEFLLPDGIGWGATVNEDVLRAHQVRLAS
jgi:galactonate dehydratase